MPPIAVSAWACAGTAGRVGAGVEVDPPFAGPVGGVQEPGSGQPVHRVVGEQPGQNLDRELLDAGCRDGALQRLVWSAAVEAGECVGRPSGGSPNTPPHGP